MEYYSGNIEPKTAKQKIIRFSALVVIVAVIIIGIRIKIEQDWRVERSTTTQLMTQAIESENYPSAISAYKRASKARGDEELTALYEKANQLNNIRIKKEKEEAIRFLVESIRTSPLSERKKKIAQLAKLEPDNQEFADEIQSAILEEEARKQQLLEEARERREKQRLAEQRKKQIETQFSAWDGSHIQLERIIKKAMNDPSSYDHVETRYADKDDFILVNTTFRGKNAFGGVVKNSITAEFTISGQFIRIIE